MGETQQVTQEEPFHRVADVLAGQHTGAAVRLRGWVHRQRSGGKIAFVTLRDGTGTVQCTVKAGIADDASLEAAKGAIIESSVSLLEGEVVEDERAPGGYEVKVTRFQLHQKSEDFPLRGEQGIEFELDNRHLWLRSSQLSAVLRVKHRLYKAIRDFFDQEGFVEVDPSVITTNACEGGSTLFEFDYFGKTAYLSQSAQMYLEGCIFGNPKVYSVTPSFRAEKSRTAKHLTEFHHLEAEYAWWEHEENLAFQEKMVAHLAYTIGTECEADLKALSADPGKLLAVKAPFKRISYHDAAARLRDLGYEFPDGEDFGTPHEQALGEEEDLTQGGTSPFFVTDWPADIKAFYMHEITDRKGPNGETLVACADLMGPGGFGELIGGSQRSEDVDWMKRRLLEQAVHDQKEVTMHGTDVPNDFLTASTEETLEKLDEKWFNTAMHWFYQHQGMFPKGLSLDQQFNLIKSRSRLETLDAIRQHLLAPYKWYFDLRRYGSVPHAGFGLGIERLLRWFTEQEHIRDMLPYPRTPSRAYP